MMNAIENGQLCTSAEQCLRHGVGRLSNFPGLLRKLIASEAWREFEIVTGEVVRMRSLAELITTPPLTGWGEDIAKVEAVIKSDAEVLTLFRAAVTAPNHRPAGVHKSADIVSSCAGSHGNSKAYTLDRLKRQAPELFDEVCSGKLSANAAAIQAGIRRKPSAAETCVKAFRKTENRMEVINSLAGILDEHEIRYAITVFTDAASRIGDK